METKRQTNWYKNVVFYQIYPRSFCDKNGDGMGDIPGIISKLDYLKDLGIDAIWLSPVYDSPQFDNGYDIADYKTIWNQFGTMSDMKRLIKECHARDIKLVMDLVVNHTSSEHKWFKDAISDPHAKYRDYYVIRRGKKDGALPPNKWTSFFGGSAWERIPGTADYYLHLFAKEQPDLNWENHKVRMEIRDILRFWLDLGIDGFRCDVINLISKDQRFKNGLPSVFLRGKKYFVNGPLLHPYINLLYENVLKDYDAMTVGETVFSTIKEMTQLVDPKNHELNMIFNFSHTDVDSYFGVKYFNRKFKLTRFKKRLASSQYALERKGWNSLFIENHDQRRSSGRFGTELGSYRVKSSKALATSYFLLKGTPFIYQGQEIGMQNMDSKNIKDYKDIEINNMYKMTQKSIINKLLISKHMFDVSRDNARTPMQWDNSIYAGFSNSEPWIKLNRNRSYINVKDSLKDEESLLNYYKKLIKLRKDHPILINGEFKLLYPHNNKLFIYTREDNKQIMLIIVSLSKKNTRNVMKNKLSGYKLLLTNDHYNEKEIIHPYEARVYIKDKELY